MGCGMAALDLTAAGDQLEERESSIGVDDAGITDIAAFRAVDSATASAVSECSGGRRAGPGGQPYRDDIAGAVLDPELAAAARSEEIRFMEVWRAWR
eukprot:232993-Alexandrium_andersonii.AAC.1